MLIILKETIYIKIILKIIFIKTIIEINKDKAKYIITACINWHVYPNYYKFFLVFMKKIYNYIKTISSPHNYKKQFLPAKYKNGNPRVKFIIK